MAENIFRFKEFSINQSRSAMKIGTDGVLLGAWCDVENASNVLDIGCGTGLISLMIAQRNLNARIFAIDIDGVAVEEAKGNFANSLWGDRLSAFVCDYAEFKSEIKFDSIVSNPPFFTEKVYSPDERRSVARQYESLPFEVLFNKSSKLLSESGTLSIIAPAASADKFLFCAGEANLWLKRKTEVLTKKGKAVKRVLWEFSKKEVKPVISRLVISSDNGAKTEEYNSLTNAFYLY